MKIKNNKDQILYIIKTKGPQTAGMLSIELDMTSMGARQLLQDLEKNQLLSTFERKSGRGRPKLYWQLTESSNNRFPDRHSDLIAEMISEIKLSFGDQGLEKLISERGQKSQIKYTQELAPYKNLKQKVIHLAKLRSAEGYMAEVEETEASFYLIENHCPICVAAKSCQSFCKSELSVFQKVLDRSVERVEYMIHGDRRCVYKINRQRD